MTSSGRDGASAAAARPFADRIAGSGVPAKPLARLEASARAEGPRTRTVRHREAP